jgi:transcriptional regulator GlxA family with amidase domain
VLFVPCGSHTAYRTNAKAEFYWFHIDAETYPYAVGTRVRYLRRMAPGDLAVYARMFLLEARNAKPDRQIALEHLAALIKLNLFRTIHVLGLDSRAEESRQQLERAMREMGANISRRWSVADLATAAGFSPSRLYREAWRHFRRRQGYLIEAARIRHASELLLGSPYTLQTIAEMTGYSDSFTFSHAFKRSTGMSPSEFRSRSGRKP